METREAAADIWRELCWSSAWGGIRVTVTTTTVIMLVSVCLASCVSLLLSHDVGLPDAPVGICHGDTEQH